MGIYGVGSTKLKKYGDEFLEIITGYCREKGIEERSKVLRKKVKKSESKKKYERVGEEYAGGKSVEHLAEQFGVNESTILRNLKKYMDDGYSIDPAGVLQASSLSERKIDEVFEAMENVGADILKPVYEELDKTVDYNELRILQLAYLAGREN